MHNLRRVRIASVLPLAIVIMGASVALDPHVGKIVSAGNGKITIVVQQGNNQTYDVAADAQIMLNGAPVKLEKLTMGDEAKLTIESKNSRQVVTKIDAMSASDKTDKRAIARAPLSQPR